MSNVLVIGGCGYIGSHCVHKLKHLGYEVSVLDSLVRGRREFIPENIPLYVGDYSNLALVQAILSDNAIETVIHCGAWTDVRESIREPMMYFINNLVGTTFLVKAMSHCHVKQIIYLSTAAVYGEVETGLAEESQVPNPVNPDGATHLGVEHLLASMVAAERWSVVIFRISNVVGRTKHKGEEILPSKDTLFSVLANVISGRQTHCEIFGCDRPTFDGSAVRDYVHVDDVANAIVSVLSHMPPAGCQVIYNLASGRGDSVHDVIRCFENFFGKEIPFVESKSFLGEVARSVLQPRKAQDELHWERRFNSLESLVNDVGETCTMNP
ncbi:MAG: NAD-dependent epimerase/dehydratase family protein [Puniceicoccales bacterium]|jgi:UDP-glucose 4-epimerase|nr:NAD-dependent epimerase/dehydratase family protein [Puniceicoccales bacterium]